MSLCPRLALAMGAAFAWVGAAAGVATQEPASVPTFAAQVDLVRLDAVVLDRAGRPVTGLSRTDLTITEDGDRQEIESFEPVAVPAPGSAASPRPSYRPSISTNTLPAGTASHVYVVVYDDIHISAQQAIAARTVVAEFLKDIVRDEDHVLLVSTSGGTWWSTRMDQGREDLLALVQKLKGQSRVQLPASDDVNEYEALRIDEYNDRDVEDQIASRFFRLQWCLRERMGDCHELAKTLARATHREALQRHEVAIRSVERALEALVSIKGRKSVLFVSGGFLFDPSLTFEKVTQASVRAKATLYFVDARALQGLASGVTAEAPFFGDPRDFPARLDEASSATRGAESLASATGGWTLANTNDFAAGLERIAAESRSYYLLGYRPTHTKADGRFRKIRVRVNREGAVVRARAGYYAPGGRSKDQKDGDSGAWLQDVFRSPEEMAAIPLRMAAYVLGPTPDGGVKVVLAGDFDVQSLDLTEHEGRFEGGVDVVFVATPLDGTKPDSFGQSVGIHMMGETRAAMLGAGYPLIHRLDLKPGRWQAKLIVRDRRSGRTGSVTCSLEAPTPSEWRVSSVALSDVLTNEQPPRLPFLTRRTFSSQKTLHGRFEVYGAANGALPRATAGYVVRKAGETEPIVAPLEPMSPGPDGSLSRTLEIPLEG